MTKTSVKTPSFLSADCSSSSHHEVDLHKTTRRQAVNAGTKTGMLHARGAAAGAAGARAQIVRDDRLVASHFAVVAEVSPGRHHAEPEEQVVRVRVVPLRAGRE